MKAEMIGLGILQSSLLKRKNFLFKSVLKHKDVYKKPIAIQKVHSKQGQHLASSLNKLILTCYRIYYNGECIQMKKGEQHDESNN